MRQVVLDTETTGLSWAAGDRVVEIGCVELLNRHLTGNHYHVYLNPERAMSAEAQKVHGLDDEFLADKPRFREVADDFLNFVRDSELIIHNAAFDVGFLNMELQLTGRGSMAEYTDNVVDTVRMAKEQQPGKKASLDALCERFGIENSHRTLHGALLDAELLAEVYLALTRGQENLLIGFPEQDPDAANIVQKIKAAGDLKVIRASESELVAHREVLQQIAAGGQCMWLAQGTIQ